MSSSISKVEFVPRTTCPLHDSREISGKLFFLRSIDDKLTGRSFKIMRCPICEVSLTDPYPSEKTVKWLYDGRTSLDNYDDPIRGTIMDKLKDLFARKDIRRLHALAEHPEIKTVLDFGTGNGRFALASKLVFPECHVDAVDFEQEPPLALCNVAGIRYLSLESFQQDLMKYDLIILRYVLEHVHNPVAFMSSMAERLAPNGVIYIEVPNLESAYVHYFSKVSNTFSIPYHLFHFNKKSLNMAVQAAGLNCKIKTKSLPLAGCILANVLKQERNIVHQVAGVILHPLELVLDWIRGKYVLMAICKNDV